MVSCLKSEHVFKMAARVSSTSSEEMASSSEDSASEDPINIAKGRGADKKSLRRLRLQEREKSKEIRQAERKLFADKRIPK